MIPAIIVLSVVPEVIQYYVFVYIMLVLINLVERLL